MANRLHPIPLHMYYISSPYVLPSTYTSHRASSACRREAAVKYQICYCYYYYILPINNKFGDRHIMKRSTHYLISVYSILCQIIEYIISY